MVFYGYGLCEVYTYRYVFPLRKEWLNLLVGEDALIAPFFLLHLLFTGWVANFNFFLLMCACLFIIPSLWIGVGIFRWSALFDKWDWGSNRWVGGYFDLKTFLRACEFCYLFGIIGLLDLVCVFWCR